MEIVRAVVVLGDCALHMEAGGMKEFFIFCALAFIGWLLFGWLGVPGGALVYLAYCDIKEEIKSIRRIK